MTIAQGEFFGAMAVLSKQPSPFNVVASEDVTVLTLTLDMMPQLIDQKPSLALEIGQMIEMRQRVLQQFTTSTYAAQRSSLAF